MQKFVCPVCRSPRKAQLADRLSAQMHLQMLLGLGVLAGAVYLSSGMTMALRTLFFYLPLWGVLEFFHGVRVRESAKCPTCAFDPVLYQRDWKAARAKIEHKLGTKMENYLKDYEQRRAKFPISASAPATATVSVKPTADADSATKDDVAPKRETQSSLF